jgi:ABC-type transporter Mla subunit MlaD
MTARVTEDLDAIDLAGRSEQIAASLSRLSGVLSQAEGITRMTRTNMGTTLDNLRIMSENFRELSELAKRYPSQLLFGQPPTEVRE